jgi:hypothetical protein
MKPQRSIAVEVLRKLSTYGAKKATELSSVVKIIQAAQDVLQVGEFAGKAMDIANAVHHFVPTMQVIVGSVCDEITFLTRFATLASTVGIGTNLLLVYQGNKASKLIAARLKDIGDTLEAQTVLMAQTMFPEYVYNMIKEGLDQTAGDQSCIHWFFVYHPDNDWSPNFHKIILEKPLSNRFCGYSHQLDTLFVFMRVSRERLREKEARARRRGEFTLPVKFHILIPAYQPVVITESLSFPKDLGDFVVEGKIHKSQELVWLNIPQEQKHHLRYVGNFEQPVGGWEYVMQLLGLSKLPTKPRILGTREFENGIKIITEGVQRSSDTANLPSAASGSGVNAQSMLPAGKIRTPQKQIEENLQERDRLPTDKDKDKDKDKDREKDREKRRSKVRSSSSLSGHGRSSGRSKSTRR